MPLRDLPGVLTTDDLDTALRGSDFVFSAIRVGGVAGRTRDEVPQHLADRPCLAQARGGQLLLVERLEEVGDEPTVDSQGGDHVRVGGHRTPPVARASSSRCCVRRWMTSI